MKKYDEKKCISIEKDDNGNLFGRELHGDERKEFIENVNKEIEYKIKPLDFVRPVSYIGSAPIININTGEIKYSNTEGFIDDSKFIGIVTEVSNGYFSVSWIGKYQIKCAWWSEEELEVVDNLLNLLPRDMTHPFGSNKDMPDKIFPITNNQNNEQN